MSKVLILDDAHVIRSLLKLTLEADSIETDCAENLQQAIELANTHDYDLIIADYMLDDGHNGLELVSALKDLAHNQNTPSIVLSAEAGAEHKLDAKSLGVKAWLKKPFTPVNILKTVYKAIDEDFDEKTEDTSIYHQKSRQES